MTTPLLNRLLDEAVERCQALVPEAQDAVAASGQVAEEALEIARFVEQEGQELRAEIGKAILAVQEAARRVTAAADSAIASLEGVPGRAGESENAVDGILAALRQEAWRFDAARQQLFEGLGTAVMAVNQDYQDLAAGLVEYMTRITKAFQEAGLGVHELPIHTLEMSTMFSHRAAETRKDVEGLGTTAEEQSAEVVRAIDQGSGTIAGHVTALINGAYTRHNQAMAELRGGVLDETVDGIADPDWVDDTLASLNSEIANLGGLPDQIEEGIFPPLTAIAGAAERTKGHLDATADSLERVLAR